MSKRTLLSWFGAPLALFVITGAAAIASIEASRHSLNIAAFWRHMGRPAVHDERGEIWVLGSDARQRSEALRSLEAPDFTLPDSSGRMHSLSDYRGKKVLLVTWSSW